MHINTATLASAACVISLFLGAPAWALPIELSFDANFPAGSPQTLVSGSFIYDAATLTSPIGYLINVDLTIAGHTYTVGELGFTVLPNGEELIGTASPELGAGASGTNNFFLQYYADFGFAEPFFLSYCTATSNICAISSSYSFFSVTAITAVPEPATWSLLLTGLFGAGLLSSLKTRAKA
jgi:hypothetical protein